MTSAQWIKTAQQLELVGHVDFTNAVPLLREGERWIEDASSAACQVNMAGVTRCNSAGAALIMGMHRRARASGKTVTFEQVPDNLISMLRLGGLDWLIG